MDCHSMGCGYSDVAYDHNIPRNKSICFGKVGHEWGMEWPESSLAQKVLSRVSKAPIVVKNSSILDMSHFICDEIIGVGGFGLVRLAVKEESLGHSCPENLKLYAIKSIPKRNILAKKNGVISVYNELNCLAALANKSPFVNKIHHAFHDSRYVYMVLDFCSGGDMRLNLRRQPLGVFSENIVRFYIAQLVLAITAVHEAGIIHRDIKPENLLLDCKGNLQLTDFGVAKFDDKSTCKSTSGTHGYMSPEIYASGHLHGRQADIFAMGVTMHELVLGSRPFEGSAIKAYATSAKRHGNHSSQRNSTISPGSKENNSKGVSFSPDRLVRLDNAGGVADGSLVMKPLVAGAVLAPEDGNTDREASMNIVQTNSESKSERRALSLRTLEHSNLSRQCKGFITAALKLEQTERLAYHGYDELYNHAWLRGIDWNGIKTKKVIPPLQVDRTKLNRDTRDFSTENLNNHYNAGTITSKDDIYFREYEYNSKAEATDSAAM